jgi:CHAD domain-containing protein
VRLVQERECTFEVDPDWVLPQVMDLLPDGGRLDKEVRRLKNTYFDTPTAGLRVFGATLRRRVGGSETGWRLKVPNGTTRTELQSGSRTKRLPAALSKGVAGLLAGETLQPVATLVTTRTAYRLLNANDELVLQIAEDQVESGPPDGQSTLRSWREVAVKLGPAGKKKDLKRTGKLLRAAGATPSTTRTKLDRAVGPLSPDGPVEPSTVGELVAAYVAAQCDVLASNDVGLRTGAPDVHQTRVAARRLRSTLRIFGDVVDTAPGEELNDELAWYAGLLGQVRDREVLGSRLTQRIADLPPEYVRGPVETEIATTLDTGRGEATQRLNEAMDTRRYQHLTELLRGWKTAPPLTDAEIKTATMYVTEAKRKADKRLRTAGGDPERLHRARKAFKRVRYAAELVEPADNKMKGIAQDAKKLQALLGEHQDCMVAADFLARISAAGNWETGESGFTYGVLMADELHRAADIRELLRNEQDPAVPTPSEAGHTNHQPDRDAAHTSYRGRGRSNRQSPSS